jgi:signal transduction histidine kinase
VKIISRNQREEVVNSLMDNINIHDLRNQINIQENLLYYLMEEYRNIPELVNYLAKILQTSEHIHATIEAADRPQTRISGPQWLNIVDAFQPAAMRADREGIVSSVDDHEAEILADPFFDRIFSILVENSIMHGEKVTLISITVKPSGSDLLLIYEDNGKGIPLNEKENVFVRGYGNNTGQGLFFVQSLLALTGITIQERGKPGKGVRFELRIPANQFRIVTE